MKALILAGGSGTRLWPLSRKAYPKQFLKLNGEYSLLQMTFQRMLNIVPKKDIIIMTNEEYKFLVNSDLSNLLRDNIQENDRNMILEPQSKNTAPAIALGVKYCIDKLGCTDKEVLFITPSDHIIKPSKKFSDHIRVAEKIAQEGHIVTFGIRPQRPETGYGYIKCNENKRGEGNGTYYEVEKFTEKPDIENARKYLKEGNYFWNSGMFLFSIASIINEFKRYSPEISMLLESGYDDMLTNFDTFPNISIDYSIMEKSDRVVMFPLDVYWNDIGSWDSISDISEKDSYGNVTKGDVISIDTKNSLILGNKRLISAIGLEDCLIVETDDAVLIAKKGEAQKVRDIVSQLTGSQRKEADEHVTTHRPWGSYTILEEGPRYKIKRIVVKPKAKLSLQKHFHRSEHWVVIKGTAKVTIGDKEMYTHENESVYVPKSTMHRLENPGKVSLEIIEVQNGEYVGEDDIQRVDDVYGRNK